MRRAELVRSLAALQLFERPDAGREQLPTPPELAAELLELAAARDDLVGRSVTDLGSGTGLLAIGAALLGAARVTGVESDARAVALAEGNAARSGVAVTWVRREVDGYDAPTDTVLMNPPFGAQRRHADRPFWESAFRCAGRAIYAFASAESRTFIARRAVAHRASILATRPVRWVLAASLPHHRKPRARIPVDLWALGPAGRERT